MSLAQAFSDEEVLQLRSTFPYFAHPTLVDGTAVAYLDSAATSQRPLRVLDAEREFVSFHNAAVHRGTSNAVGAATTAFEDAREAVAQLVNAAPSHTVVWASGATDALNILALGIGEATLGASAPALAVAGSERFVLQPGDEILVTEAEHHANLVPWQRLAAKTGASLKYIPVDQNGVWGVDQARQALNSRTRVFAFTHVSNVTGQVSEVAELVAAAAELTGGKAITVLDACQSVPHIRVDLQELGVDFAAFSSHKMFGPNGTGALVGRTELLDALPPARTGGSAITRVTMEHTEFLPAPARFEAGTPAVSQVVGFGEAARMLQELDMDRVAATEHALVERLVDGLLALPKVKLIGPQSSDRVALTAIGVEGLHGHDLGQVLDVAGVLVRTGHHCAQPLHRAVGVPSSVRASVHVTSTVDEVERFLAGVEDALRYFELV